MDSSSEDENKQKKCERTRKIKVLIVLIMIGLILFACGSCVKQAGGQQYYEQNPPNIGNSRRQSHDYIPSGDSGDIFECLVS